MNDAEIKAWHDIVLRDIAEIKIKIETYLHKIEGSLQNDPHEFDNLEICEAMRDFENGCDKVGQYVARMYINCLKMGKAAGSA